MQKVFRRALTALLIVACVLTAAIVGATVKLYTATGEDYANEVESQDIAKLRARDKAIKNATKQAGVYLRSYSSSVNGQLTDDDILAITSNAWQLVGEPKYTRTVNKISDETTIIVWTASVEVNVDDAEIQSWLKRDDKDKYNIISQTRETQKASEENERKIEDLRAKYNRATSQAEKDSIRKQMNDADRDFLANQKFKEGNKLNYSKNYNGAIKLYNEALEFGEYVVVYNNRGNAYSDLGQNEQAIKDFDKAIKLNPNLYQAYYNRGIVYSDLGQYERAIQDYDKAIELNPNDADAYNNRGCAYHHLGQKERAIKDFDKAIKLNPNYANAYYNRGVDYDDLEQHERAIQDYNKTIEINPNFAEAYNNRGLNYSRLKQYEQAIQDFNKAIELDSNSSKSYLGRALSYALTGNLNQAIADATKAIKLSPNNAMTYKLRGKCYQALGETEKAQADFDKAKELSLKD